MLWLDDDHDVLLLSCELSENMPKLLSVVSDVCIPANGEPMLNIFSVSEPVERRGGKPASRPSGKEGNASSIFGLPGLTKDISVSGADSSP